MTGGWPLGGSCRGLWRTGVGSCLEVVAPGLGGKGWFVVGGQCLLLPGGEKLRCSLLGEDKYHCLVPLWTLSLISGKVYSLTIW